MAEFQPIEKKIRVAHFPQVPCKPFIVEVNNEREAWLLTVALSNQHLWLLEQNIIPDFANVVLVEMLAEGGWEDYYNEAAFADFDECVETFTDYFGMIPNTHSGGLTDGE